MPLRFGLVIALAGTLLGDKPVTVLRASADPELKDYLSKVGAVASQHTDDDGRIWIQLDDTKTGDPLDVWGAFLEELAHAVQNRNNGSISLSADDTERNARECEVARCLLKNADVFRLSPADRAHYEQAVKTYCGGEQ